MVNDSSELTIDLDGTIFTSRFLDDFEPNDRGHLPARFSLDDLQCLTACKIYCKLPVAILINARPAMGWLATTIHLSTERYTPSLQVDFEWEGDTIQLGELEVFEGVFDVLKNRLPAEVTLKSCYTCQYSDYSVYGSQVFGSMLCFRNHKEAYLQVKDKDEYMHLMDQYERMVQETYLCDDFEHRRKGTGYRG